MKALLSRIYWSRFAQPANERILFRSILSGPPQKILELGLGDGCRAERLIQLTRRLGIADLRYVGVDLFEARSEGVRGIGLKKAYTNLVSLGADVKLIPGSADLVLPRISNAMQQNDLLLIDAGEATQNMQEAWFYLPRMLAGNARAFEAVQLNGMRTWRPVAMAELQARAEQSDPRQRKSQTRRAA